MKKPRREPQPKQLRTLTPRHLAQVTGGDTAACPTTKLALSVVDGNGGLAN
jgi:hypothetical protein